MVQQESAVDVYGRFMDWLRESDRRSFERCIKQEPCDVERHRAVFDALGFPMPVDYEEFLQRLGRVAIDAGPADISFSPLGDRLALANPYEIVHYAQHQFASASRAGVARAKDLICYAVTSSADDAIWVFDRRCSEEAVSIGLYHQDVVSERPDSPLRCHYPSFTRWLVSYLAAVRRGLEERSPEYVDEDSAESDLTSWRLPDDPTEVDRFCRRQR